ncbi:hypothetical protein GCM10018953_31580 [Streptosporangium nondiastaticum]
MNGVLSGLRKQVCVSHLVSLIIRFGPARASHRSYGGVSREASVPVAAINDRL